MFNLYQSINKKDEQEKEPSVIGHERWYQERTPRSGSRKKKRPPKRTHSAAEFPAAALTAACRREAFRNRSQSSESRSDDGGQATPQRVDSLARIFSLKRSSGIQKHEYSALKTDCGNEKFRLEKQINSEAFSLCKHYLSNNERYELKSQLGTIGARPDKQWFMVQDRTLGAERLLTVTALPGECPIGPSEETRTTLRELFRTLQHPYIHPVLDVEFWGESLALVTPLNPAGSLRDVIYGTAWHEDSDRKYSDRGAGLCLRTVQCLGRQILEALLFLRERSFPPFAHLHAGNVIIQNGVARLAGLENALLGLPPPPQLAASAQPVAFGHLLFEMTAGYRLQAPPTAAHLQLELERTPRVADALQLIFHAPQRPPTLEELACCELFRGVELRELRGAAPPQQAAAPPHVRRLLAAVRAPAPQPPPSPPSPVPRSPIATASGRQEKEVLFTSKKRNHKSKSVFIRIVFGRKTFLRLVYDNHDRNCP